MKSIVDFKETMQKSVVNSYSLSSVFESLLTLYVLLTMLSLWIVLAVNLWNCNV